MPFESEPRALVAAITLTVLWTAELSIPFYQQLGTWKLRLCHDGKNLLLGAFNALVVGAVSGAALVVVTQYTQEHAFGLLRLVSWPVGLELLLALLLFDFWMYLWHVANHRIPMLWRFHRMHHSDPHMDATTGVRFHVGEALISAAARLVVLPLIGMDLWQLVVYECLFLPIVLLHHSNVSLPRWLDHGLLAVIVTPAMHRVHHSRWRPETDSNYGSVLPYWDLLLRTFRLRGDARDVEIGLDGMSDQRWQSLWGMLRTPFASISQPDRRHDERAPGSEPHSTDMD